MRLGINLLCVTDFVEEKHVPILELAKRTGFDGVEIPVLKGSPEHYQHLGHVLNRLGLARTMTSIVSTQDANPVSPDPEARDRGIPGTGQIDFPAIFRARRATGFDGWLCIEAFGSGLPEIAAATRVWRPLFPDTETLFAESAAFVRRTWQEALN